MPHHKSLLLIIALTLLSACTSPSTQSQAADTLELLTGSWAFEDTELIEIWERIADKHYRGTVNRSFNGQLEPTQYIDIYLHPDSCHYVGTRIGAHESSLPIQFHLIEAGNGRLNFENSLGRFPQSIVYQSLDQDRFTVTMSGEQEGRTRSQTFNYKRLK